MYAIKKAITILMSLIIAFFGNILGIDNKVSSPFEYKGYSQAKYLSYEKRSQYVEMDDGTKIAVDIYIPANCIGKAETSFPVVFQYTPYGRAYAVPYGDSALENIWNRLKMTVGADTDFSLILDRANSYDTVYGSTKNIVNNLLSHGYVYVCADVRGTGASFGVKKDFMPEIATDGKQLIDWMAEQEWCDGNVGMFGGSYLGYTQIVVAGQQPEALKAIFPEVVGFDGYTGEIRPGGIFLDEYSSEDLQTYLEWNCYMPDDYIYPTAPVVDEDGDGEYADEIPLDLDGDGNFLNDYNYPDDPDDAPQYADGNKRENHIYYMASREHLQNIPYNEVGNLATYIDKEFDFGDGVTRTAYDVAPAASAEAIAESGIAIYNHGSWMDTFITGTTEIYCTLKDTNPSKLIIDPGYHETYSPYWEYCGEDEEDSIDAYKTELLRFFDYYLKGIDNGLADEDPVYIYNMNGDGWRSEKEWPLARQVETDYYFNSENILSTSQGSGTDEYKIDLTQNSSYETQWYDYDVSRYLMCEPDEIPDRTEEDKKCLTYTTAAFTEDTEVTGYPIISFYASSTSDDADFHVYLEDIDEDGNAILVTEGLLRGGYAENYDNDNMVLGGNSSIDVEPELPWHGYEEDQYNGAIFADGNIVNLEFELFPTSWTFKEGHSLRISIACADSPTFEQNPAVDENTVVTIYHNSQYPSKITLPIIPE